jgi:hypothetical protein
MSRRTAAPFAWSLCALCVALAAASLLLAALNGRVPREILIDEGIIAIATLAVAFSVVGALIASHRPERGPALVGPEGPAEEGTSHTMFVVVEFAAFPMLLLAGLGAVVSLFLRFRRASETERQQIKWFAFASVLTFAFVFVWNALLDAEGALLQASFAVLSVLLVPAIPVATGIAILRYRLYDIDRLVNRTLVYAALTGTLVVVYVGGVVLLQTLFRTLAGGESTLAVVASTVAIAAMFNPLRRRIQESTDRRFYRKRYDATKTLEAFGARLRDEVDLDTLASDLTGVVRKTMQPAHASIWLREPDPKPGGAEARP